MDTKTKLNEAIKDAMKAKDTMRKTTLRMAMAAIQFVEKTKGEIDEDGVISILQKEVKSRNEAIADAEKAGRPELVAEAKAEIEILQPFLPKGLSEDELMKMVKAALAESGATTPREMGKVMQILMPKVKGRADGKVISGMVNKLMQG